MVLSGASGSSSWKGFLVLFEGLIGEELMFNDLEHFRNIAEIRHLCDILENPTANENYGKIKSDNWSYKKTKRIKIMKRYNLQKVNNSWIFFDYLVP